LIHLRICIYDIVTISWKFKYTPFLKYIHENSFLYIYEVLSFQMFALGLLKFFVIPKSSF